MRILGRTLLTATLALATIALLAPTGPLLASAGAATSGGASAGGADKDKGGVRGGGTSLVTGGTGSPSFAPIKTTFAFSWGSGVDRFECLALTPTAAAGAPGSGNFDNNIMYVTGPITSAEVKGRAAILKGLATVTGAGAGSNRPFTLTVTPGGPGATLVLEVSGLVFNEIVLEGGIEF